MPKPDDDTVQDDPIEVNGSEPAPSLDQVHALSQAHVDAEDEEAAAAGDDDAGDGSDDDGAGGDAGDDDTGDGAGDGAGDADDDDDAAGAGTPPAPVAPETPAAAPEATTGAELNTDITKNGEGKVAIKNADGETQYFNSLDEVPEDFEPATYKAFMVGTRALIKKEDSDAAAIAKTQADAEVADRQKATDEMQQGWEADATALSTSGVLPKDPAKLETAKNEVYDYIESELKKFQDSNGKEGAIHTNFRAAYKAMAYDKQQAGNQRKQQELDDAKKKRGGVVQGGSGGGDGKPVESGTRGKVIEAPPSGVGLDAVHNRAIASL